MLTKTSYAEYIRGVVNTIIKCIILPPNSTYNSNSIYIYIYDISQYGNVIKLLVLKRLDERK